MNIKNLSITILSVFVVIVVFMLSFTPSGNKERKERVDLGGVRMDRDHYLLGPIIANLWEVVSDKKPNFNYPPETRLRDAFKDLNKTGKVSIVAVEAVEEFDRALDCLTEAIKKINDTPSLRVGMSF